MKKYYSNLIWIAILTVITFLLYKGSLINKVNDVDLYRCYSLAFWKGGKFFLENFRDNFFCLFATGYNLKPFQTLPTAYGVLSLIPFSIPLIFESNYKEIYMLLMMIDFIFTFVFILKKFSLKSGLLYVLFTLAGCAGFAFSRMDILLGSLILFSVYYLRRKKYLIAYLLLAIGVGMKYIPIILLIPFFVYQIRGKTHNIKYKDLKGLVFFTVIVTLVMVVSWSLNWFETIYPFLFNSVRPIQVESIPASIIFLLSKVGIIKIKFVNSYGSDNILPVSFLKLSTLISLTGILGFIFLYYRTIKAFVEKKITIENCCLIIIYFFILTNKIFSTQYILWIIPLWVVAKNNRRWNILGYSLFLLTGLIFPFAYHFLGVSYNLSYLIGVRNILFIYIGYLLYKSLIFAPTPQFHPNKP